MRRSYSELVCRLEVSMIVSVLGPVPAERLGPTDCHGHLLIRGGLPVVLEPDFLLDDVDAAVREASAMLAAGGAALVDCMPLGVGRDVDGLVSIAEQTGLVVVAATGFHKDRYYARDHWARTYDVDRITGLLVAEAAEGMERSGYGGPFVERSAARAGVIKVATTGDEPTPLEHKLLTAVGAAAAATGLPVITHTESFASALGQVAALADSGVPPSRVVLSHMDRHCSADQLASACETGATVCLDWLGRLDRRPDKVVTDLAAAVVARGYGDRVVLGQDLARRQYWRSYGGGPGLAHLFETVRPLLHTSGLDDAEVHQIMVANPRRAFAVDRV